AGTVSSTDNILQAIQKLNGNNSTNANLTGPITSIGNATAVASQTGTGSTFVMNASPTLVTPVLGVATATSINGSTIPTSKTLVVNTDKLNVLSSTTSTELAGVISDETGTGSLVLSTSPALVTPVLGVATATSINGSTIPTSKTLVVTTDKLNVLSATTSAELAGVISDETGTGSLVLSTSPTLVTPSLGTPSALVGTNITGTAAGLTAGNVTTNANLTGDITSSGNATTIGASKVTNTMLAGSIDLTSKVTGILPIVNGGTGSATKNFVDITTTQTIAGAKTFNSDISVNGINIGRGNGGNFENVAIGTNLGLGTGSRNTGLGARALTSYSGTTFGNNTGVGYANMTGLTTGYGNTSVGAETMSNIAGNNNNTAIGNQTLMNSAANNNTALGANAGNSTTTGSGNTFLGMNTTGADGAFSNTTAIGYQASVTASNTIQLGNTGVTNVQTSGTITAGAVIYTKTDGTIGQVLTTNGAGVTSWGTPTASVREVADEFSATASQSSFTLAQTKSINSKVKMYINGVRISNTAYSVAGTTLTYTPASNGGYALVMGDRIQFDYFY
ncbi:hypothetical protein SAMN05444396_1111, partial [Flavobacterium segetis]